MTRGRARIVKGVAYLVIAAASPFLLADWPVLATIQTTLFALAGAAHVYFGFCETTSGRLR